VVTAAVSTLSTRTPRKRVRRPRAAGHRRRGDHRARLPGGVGGRRSATRLAVPVSFERHVMLVSTGLPGFADHGDLATRGTDTVTSLRLELLPGMVRSGERRSRRPANVVEVREERCATARRHQDRVLLTVPPATSW
jgi:hypothetical protein